MDGYEVTNAVPVALEAGYRHFDTAKIYGNEYELGQALRSSGVPRNELFVTTKLWVSDHGFKQAQAAFQASLHRLGMDYVDLYLIHWPGTEAGNNFQRNAELRAESWRALEKIYTSGKAKAIGVSNYTIHHLEQLLRYCSVVPQVNQVEFHPKLYQRELLEYCKRHNIVLEGYSPLGRGKYLNHPSIKRIAEECNKTPAQVMLRWSLQHGVVTIPKSTHRSRIIENTQVFDFELSRTQMGQLDALNSNLRVQWNPENVA
jgi:diketogulonate reductase-like aldo/keto reductase